MWRFLSRPQLERPTGSPVPSSETWPCSASPGAPLSFPPASDQLRSFISYVVSAFANGSRWRRRSHVNDVNPQQPRHVHKPPVHKGVTQSSGRPPPMAPLNGRRSSRRTIASIAMTVPSRLALRRPNAARPRGRLLARPRLAPRPRRAAVGRQTNRAPGAAERTKAIARAAAAGRRRLGEGESGASRSSC